MLLKSLTCSCHAEYYTFKYKYSYLANYDVSTYVVPHLVVYSQSQYTSLRQARKFVLTMLKVCSSFWTPHDQDLSLDHPIEIQKQSASQKLRHLSVTLRRGP